MFAMGKALSFLLASADLAALFALAGWRRASLADDLALLASVVAVALLAWAVAAGTALYRALRGESWRPVAALLVFVWLPVAPALVYGASGVRDLFGRRAKKTRRVVVPGVKGRRGAIA